MKYYNLIIGSGGIFGYTYIGVLKYLEEKEGMLREDFTKKEYLEEDILRDIERKKS